MYHVYDNFGCRCHGEKDVCKGICTCVVYKIIVKEIENLPQRGLPVLEAEEHSY